MKVWFSQFYIEPGVNFPFSHLFQKRLSREVTALVEPSAKFLKKCGGDFDLTFNVSAKERLEENEIRGATVFKKTKDVEYTIFLPFGVVMRHEDAPRVALTYLLDGACEVFERLEIDTTRLLERKDALIESICADPTMLEEPSFDEEENNTRVRKVFEAFFQKKRKGN